VPTDESRLINEIEQGKKIASDLSNTDKRKTAYLEGLSAIILIIVVSGLVYYNGLDNEFVADDGAFIKDNTSIRSLSNVPAMFFSPSSLASRPIWGTVIYRPLRTLSYALDYRFFSLNSFWYHLTSLVLHMLVCISFYFLIKRLFLEHRAALLGAIIFAVHPVHVDAVSWIASRADLIGTLFFNLSLISYISYRRGVGHRFYFLLSVAFSLLAYFGKETMVPLTGMIVLYDYATAGRTRFLKVLSSRIFAWTTFALVCFGYLFIRYKITGRMDTYQGWWGGSAYSNFLMMFKATALYLKLLVFPFDLKLHYDIEPVYTLLDFKVLISLALIVFSFVAIAICHNRNRMVFFSLLWFFLALVPIANIIPIAFSMMAERYAYMPSAGPIMTMAFGISYLHRKYSANNVMLWNRIFPVLIVIILITFSIKDILRNQVYRNNFIFYTAAVNESPKSSPGYKGLGGQYVSMGQHEKAIDYFKKAIEFDPYYTDAYLEIAGAYNQAGDTDSALESVRHAVSIDSSNADTRFRAGNVYKDMEAWDKARDEWKQAIALRPDFIEAYNNLGNSYLIFNDYARASEMYSKILEIDPDNEFAHYNISLVYKALNDPGRSEAHYKIYLQLTNQVDQTR
jgi:tetratricopeptide (TPR) repeat protein